MVATKFLSAGCSEQEALEYTCTLAAKLFLEEDNLLDIQNIDIRCQSAREAEKLDELMWIRPEDVLIPHSLTHLRDKKIFAEIGYPGSKFSSRDNKALVNLNPDLPNQISNYLVYFQLVIEDNSVLRERAAATWKECNSMGLEPTFVENK